MAVTFVASSAVATGTNPTVSLPAGVVEKDLLLLITTGTATPTTPAGWTLRSAQGANNFLTVFFKFATGTEAASLALTVTGTTTKAVMLAYRGASAIDTVSGFTNAVGATSLAPGLTGNTQPNDLEISVYAGNNAVGAWGAAPAPTTSRVSSDPTAAVNGLLIVDETQAAAGNSTARTGTISTAHTLSSVAIAIIPSGRYWVGGTGTWTTTTTNWSQTSGGASGAPAPTANDPVFFDQAATYTVTLTGALTCFGMTVSAGTVTFSSTGTIANSGSMSLSSSTVWSATGLITFNSTSTGRTVTTNGVTINSPITFDGVAGVWSLGSALSTGVTLTTTLNNGTLTLNGFDLNTGSFSSSVATARSIAFGSNNIVLNQTTAASTVLNMATATLFTYTGTGGFTSAAAVTKTYVFGTTGGSATNAPNLTLTGSGTAVQTFTTASWFGTLSFGTTAFNPGTTALSIAGGLTLSTGGTFTTLGVTMVGTGTITPNGKTIAAFTVNTAGTVTLAGALAATTYTQTAGAVNFASNNLSCSGAVAYSAGTLTNIATITCTTWTVTGAFTLSQGTITPSTSFVLTSGSFTYSGGTLSPVPTFTHTAGTVTLGQNYSLTSTGTYTLVAGTLTMTDRNLTAAAFITSGTGTRSINFGTSGYGEITVTGNNVTVWDGGGAGITYTGYPRIVATYTGAVGTRTVNLGTAWTEATAFDVQMQPASYPFVYGFQIINGSTDIIALAGVANNVSLTGFLFTLNLGVMTVYGNYTIDATGGTVSSSANTTTFASTNASARTITISRTVDFPITFSGVGGTFNLGATLTTGSTRTMTLTAGTLVLNGNSVSTGIFSSTGTGTRAINFGGNFIALSSLTAATTVLSMADATNFTVSGAGGFNSIMAVAKTFVFGTTGGSATNAPNLFINAGSGIPTITTNSWFNTLNFTGSTSTPAATTVFVSTLTLATGGTYTALTPIFTSTQTWTPQFSKQLAGLGVNIPGGTLTLGGSQSLIATATTTLTAGTLDLNGNDLTTGIFSSSNTNTRSIVFGSNNINLTHTTAAQTVLAMADATNFTLTASTGGFVSNLAVTRTFQFGSTAGGTATNAPNLTITSGAAIPTITTNSWFNALNFTGTTATPAATTVFVSTLTLATGGTYTALTPIFTRTQTWTTQFSKQLGGLGFNLAGGTLTLGDSPSLVATGTTTLTAGTLDLGGFNLTTGIFSSTNTNTRSIAFGSNNIILSHTTAAQTVLSMAIATGFTYTGTGGFTTDASVTRTCVFGTTGGSATNAPNLSLTGTGVAIVTLTTGSWFNNLSFGSTAFALAATTLNINGNLTLSTGGTFTSLTLNMVGTGTITSNAKPILALTINNVSGTTTLGDALTLGATAATTLTSGNLALNGFTLTTGTFVSTNTNTRSIAFGTGIIVLATTTLALVNLSMADATNFTYTTSGTFGSGTGCFQATMSVTRTFTFGTTSASGTAANAPILYLVSGASVPTITTGSWFKEINFGTTAFTIAATNLNLANIYTVSSTSVLTALTATMVATGTIYAVNSIGPVVVNTAGITTSFQNLATSRCTTLTVTQGTVFLDTNCTLICSSTCTLNTAGTLDMNGQIQCTTFTVAGATYSVSSTCSWIISTSVVITSGTLNINYSPAGGLGATPTPTFTHTAGTVNVNADYALTATGTYTFTAGTLNINDGVTLSTGIFSSTNANTRTINFGITTSPGYIALTHTTAATVVLSMAIMTGLTINAKGKWDGTTAGPTQNAGGFVSNTAVTKTFTCGTTGGNSTNAPCLTVYGTGATQLPTFTTASWFGDFNIYNLSTMTIAATTLNINSLYGAGYFNSVNTTSLSLNFVGSGFINYQGDTNNTFGILGTVTINHSGTTAMVYAECCATTVAFTAGTLETRYWVNGAFSGYGSFKITGTFTQTGGTWYNNFIYITSCATYTINGPSITFNDGSITATTSLVLTSGSFTYGGTATLSAVPLFTHTAGTVTFNKDYALAATGTYTLTAGTLVLARGSILNTGIFSSTGAGTRSIGFGSSISTPSGSVAFDGTNQYLTISGNNAFAFGTSDYTVELWAYPNSGTWTSGNFYFWDICGGNVTLQYYQNQLSFYNSTTGTVGNLYNSGKSLSLNTWVHIAIVRQSGTTKMFVDGTLVASASDSFDVTQAGTVYVGVASSLGQPFQGYISNLRMVKGVAVYTSTFTPPTLPYTATQSANTNGNPSAAITGVQTSLLLNTSYGSSLTDSSTYGFTVINNNGATGLRQNPFTSNINLTHTTAATTVLSMATVTGFTYTGTGGFTVADMANTRTFTYGTTGGSITNAVNLTFTTGASVATLTTASWFDNLDFGTTTFNPGTTALNIAGDLTLSGGGTYTTMTPTMLGTGNITSNGAAIAGLVINSTSGTTSLRSALATTATGTTTLTSGTLALNSFDLSTGIFSSSGAVARSVSFGTTSSAITGSAYFNGTNQYFSAASNTAYEFATGDFTVEAWINLTTTAATWAGICQSDPFGTRDTNNFEFYLADNPVGRLVFSDGFQTSQITIPFSPVANAWYHVAVTRQNGVMRMFVNGVSGTLTLSGTDPGTVSWNQNGIVSGYNSSNGGYFPGYISNLRVVKGVAVYTGDFTLPSSPLAATQSSSTNISAITGTQTSLLLNTAYGINFLADSSTYNSAITNGGAVTSSKTSPYRSNINLTHTTAATTVLSMATATGFTYTGTGGFVVPAMTNTRTFNVGATAGGSLTTAPNLTFTTGASVATLTTGSWFDNLDFGTTTFNPGTTALNITGDLTLSSTGTYTTMTPSMVGTGTITSNTNATLAALTINSTSGTTSLGDAFSLSATGTTTLTSGTLAMNNFNLTTGIFSSSGAVTRSIAFGGSTAATSASFNGSTQYASYAINSNIQVTANQPFTVEFWIYTPTQVQTAPAVFGTSNNGGLTGDTAFFVGHSGLGITNQYGFYLAGLTNGIGGAGTTSNLLASTGNYIRNAWTHIALVRVGNDALGMYINGVLNGTAIYSGAINFPTNTLWVGTSGNNFPGSHYTGYISNFRWVTGVAVYTGNFAVPTSPLTATQSSGTNISAITGTQTSLLLNTVTGANILADSSSNNYTPTNVGSVAGIFYNPFAGVINLAHTTAATTVLNMATATAFTLSGTGGFTATAAITRTYVFGTTGGSAAISPNLWLTGSGTAIATITTASWFNLLDFGTTAFTIAATALNLNALTLSTGGTFTNLTPTMVGTGTITTNGKTLPALTVNTAGTATLAGALTLSGALTLTQGTLASSTYPVTSATFASTGTATRSMTGSGTYTISGAGATAFSNASATGITITGLIISMTAATAKTFAGGGGSYSTLNQGGAGALTISGNNSFSDLTATTRPSTITFTAGSTQTFADFTLSGVLGSLVTINSSVAGTRASLSKSSGTVSVGYLSIQDSAAIGGAGWYAGTTSTNVSNNLGWVFTAPPAPGSVYLGNFFAFF